MGNNKVLIDTRAGSKELIHYPPIDVIGELCLLDSADAMIIGNGPDGENSMMIGVEIKSMWDLMQSAGNGRLQATQVPAMLEMYNVPWLLTYGQYRPHPKTGQLQIARKGVWTNYAQGKRPVPYGYIEGLLFSLTVAGIHVKRVLTIEEAAVWIGCLARWWWKPWDEHKSMRKFDKSQKKVSWMPEMADEGELLRATVAAQLPGIGYERGVLAARHFKSIRAMILASADEWAAIPGIGKVIGKAVERAVR